MGRPTSAVNGETGNGDSTDELYDSELLDLLQSYDDDAALSAISQLEQTQKSDGANTKPFTARHESVFLVGGSLFSRSQPRQLSGTAGASTRLRHHSSLTAPFAAQSMTPRRAARQTTMLLSFGSLFCPFTRQFFAVRSPHWDTLRRLGFGINGTIRNGRRIELAYPGLLLRTARSLQATASADRRQAGTSAEAFSRGVAVPAAVQWSPLLASTLGPLLRRAPVDSLDAFKDFIHRELAARSDVEQGRQIPLCFPVSWRHGGHVAPAQTEPGPRFLDAPSLETQPVRESDPPTNRRRSPSPNPLLLLGEQWVQQAVEDRTRHVQLGLPQPSAFATTTITTRITHEDARDGDSVAASHPLVQATTALLLDSDTAPSGSRQLSWCKRLLPRSTDAYLVGLPRYTRVAWLRIPVSRERSSTDLSPFLRDTCGCLILQQAQRPTAPSDASARLSDGDSQTQQRVLFCPIEHAVDYNTVMDLVAYPVFPNASLRVQEWLCKSEAQPVSLLSLGLSTPHANSDSAAASRSSSGPHPDTLVVISNAHLLSRRAVSRMLDQWTRNGAADRLARERRSERASTRTCDASPPATDDRGRRRFSWHMLLNLDPFTSPIRRRYLMPFGNVRALFVALEPSRGADSDPPCTSSSDATKSGSSAGPSHSVFHLSEPLSATLLRLGPLFRTRLDDEERLACLGFLSTCAQKLLPADFPLSRHQSPSTGLLTSNPTLDHTHLGCAAGNRLFVAGCEALLLADTKSHGADSDAAMDLQSVERIIGAFPFLSSITFSHRLMDAFRVDVRETGDRQSDPHHQNATSDDTDTTFPLRLNAPPPPSQEVCALTPLITASRHDANEREERETVCRARLQRAMQVTRACSSSATRQPPCEEQKYESFVEPALLLGSWTRTVLFCAPVVADVLPLRAHIQFRMQRQLGRQGRARKAVVVRDVDIFHVDYVAFNLLRRCRLFGVRAWFSDAVRGASTHPLPPQAEVEELLQSVLREYAADPLFFPLWTYNADALSLAQRKDTARGTPRNLAEPYRFSSVPEWRSPITPTTVERRLFAMAVAQYPALHLARGSRIVLHHTVRCTNAASTEHAMLPAGTVCVVTRFAPLSDPPTHMGHQAEASIASLRQDDMRVPELYLQQQRGPTQWLPVVKPLFVPQSPLEVDGLFDPTSATMPEFLLLPQPILLGGFRSVHYYSLPLLHLPCHVLAGGDPSWTSASFTKVHHPEPSDRLVPADITFAFAAPLLLHPYHGASSSKSTLCLTRHHRRAISASLLAQSGHCGGSCGSSSASTAPVFFEDLLNPSPPVQAETEGHKKENKGTTDLVASEALGEGKAGAVLWDPVLTELALFLPPSSCDSPMRSDP